MIAFRFVAGVLLLLAAIVFTWRTVDGLAARRVLRTELAEISHARYGILDADRWIEKILPVLYARIDALDLTPADRANLRPTVERALYRLLDDVKEKMSAPNPASKGAGGFLGQGNALVVNMMAGALRSHVPEYADVVLAELAKPDNKQAFRNYVKGTLAGGVKNTFGHVDMRWYSSILKKHGCADASACQQQLAARIREADAKLEYDYLIVLASAALAFLLFLAAGPVLGRSAAMLLLLFCAVLLLGGLLTPMLEVEAKISQLKVTFLGTPIVFGDQVLYFQSKSVLEVFRVLINQGRPDMWIVGVLVLMFSVVFPAVKISTLSFCLLKPSLLRNRLARFIVLESSKWSMADVMALAIFMAYVAFNGLISNSMSGLLATGADVTIPTDSSKILPGYYLFVAFCLASLLLSAKLQRGLKTLLGAEPV
jgi:hypothetical protein